MSRNPYAESNSQPSTYRPKLQSNLPLFCRFILCRSLRQRGLSAACATCGCWRCWQSPKDQREGLFFGSCFLGLQVVVATSHNRQTSSQALLMTTVRLQCLSLLWLHVVLEKAQDWFEEKPRETHHISRHTCVSYGRPWPKHSVIQGKQGSDVKDL